LRAHDGDDGVDQDTGREVLAGAGFGILRVFFEQPFVDVALDVGAEGAPGFLIDEIDDEAAQVGGVLDLVLGFAENDAENAVLAGRSPASFKSRSRRASTERPCSWAFATRRASVSEGMSRVIGSCSRC
jgi:hypothetical protein